MVILTRRTINTKSSYLFKTTSHTLAFDCPADLYGKNHRIPSFDNPPKLLKFYVSIETPQTVFVSNPELSLGIFFLPVDSKVYLTEEAYEQIVFRVEQYKKMSVTFDEDDCVVDNSTLRKVSIKDARPPKIVKITINQIFTYNQVNVRVISGGAFQGWVNFLVKEKHTFLYCTTIFLEARLVCPVPELTVDFLILNRDSEMNCFNDRNENYRHNVKRLKRESSSTNKTFFGVDSLNLHLKQFSQSKIVFICEFTSQLPELLHHTLYILKDSPIYVLHGINTQIKRTNLFFVEDLNLVTHANFVLFSEKDPCISGSTVFSINSWKGEYNFFIPFESALDSIYERFHCKVLVNSSHGNATDIFNDTNNFSVVRANTDYYINTESESKIIEIENSHLVYSNGKDLIVEGEIELTDKNMENNERLVLKGRTPLLKTIFEDEEYYYYEGEYYFPKRGIIVNFENGPLIRKT